MDKLQEIADRVEIEALRAEYTDAGMMGDLDRMASLFTEDCELSFGRPGFEFHGRDEIRSGVERARGTWEFFVQNTHPGYIRIDGDTAFGRTYMMEFGRFRDGSSMANYALYHDRYRRTADGWKFLERRYEVRYLDGTPLPGSPPENDNAH